MANRNLLSTVRCYSDAAKKDSTDSTATDTAADEPKEPVSAEVYEELRVKYETKDKENAKLKEAYQRSVADFRNLQKTTENEIRKAKDFALQKFAKDLIDTVDNFDLALDESVKPQETSEDVKKFVDGVKMVQSVLEKTLNKHGVEKMNPMGEQYDPNEHEALFQVPQPDKEAGTIFHVDRTGFKLNGRVLRAPKVGIVAEKE